MSKQKYKVHVRAKKIRLKDAKGIEHVYLRGHVFKDPWPGLIELARNDVDNRVLRLEPNAQEEALLNEAKEGDKK